jgi:hypothetical protein
MPVDNFNEDWVRSSRAKVGRVVLDGDRIDWNRSNLIPKTFTTWNDHNYLGFTLEGAWENDMTKMGGSFKSYAIYDENIKTGYFIDTAVYYPAGTKIPYLYELEGVAKSLNIKE